MKMHIKSIESEFFITKIDYQDTFRHFLSFAMQNQKNPEQKSRQERLLHFEDPKNVKIMFFLRFGGLQIWN